MNVNGKEIIRRTLEFDNPERVARSFGDSDLQVCFIEGDLVDEGWVQVEQGIWERFDMWGNLWKRVDPTSKGEVVKGALEKIEDAKEYCLPSFDNDRLYENTVGRIRSLKEKWILGALPGFTFNVARNIFKLEDYLCFLITNRKEISEFHDRIDEQLKVIIGKWAEYGVDGIIFWEDWGTQNQTLVSPSLWREEFLPRFKNLMSYTHDAGLKVFMHSCGAIQAIVPDLIGAGVDVLQFDQPMLHGIENLAKYQGAEKISFWCPVDVQRVLPSGDEKLIRSYAQELLDGLWKGRGGFIAGYYGDESSIGVDPMWQRWACEEFAEKGVSSFYEEH